MNASNSNVLPGSLEPTCWSDAGTLRDVVVHRPDPVALTQANFNHPAHGFRDCVDPRVVVEQWELFVELLRNEQVSVHEVEEEITGRDLPVRENAQYTRDLGAVFGQLCFIGAPATPSRRAEMLNLAVCLETLGIEMKYTAPVVEFGDVVLAEKNLVISGFGARSTRLGLKKLQAQIANEGWRRWLMVDLSSIATGVRFAHLDLCFNIVDSHRAVVYESLLNLPAELWLGGEYRRSTFGRLLEEVDFTVTPVGDAVQTAAGINFLNVRPGRAIVYLEALEAGLSKLDELADVEFIPLNGSELIKTGGGPRCLSMPLVRV